VRNPETPKSVLLPYQLAWVNDPSPVKVVEKSRRVGLSWTEAADSVLYAANVSGGDVWYVGYNREMAEQFLSDCAFWAREFDRAAEEDEAGSESLLQDKEGDIYTYRIKFASGHRVAALSSRPSNLRGKQGRVVLDEAAFHEDFSELLKAAMATLMWGGSVRIISTHNGADNPFNALVCDCRAGRLPYSLHRVTLDDALKDGLYKRICLATGREYTVNAENRWRRELYASYGEAAAEELDCVPSNTAGAFLSSDLVRSCMEPGVPVLRFSCPDGFAQRPDFARQQRAADFCRDEIAPVLEGLDPNRPCYAGEDFGRSGDLTVVPVIQEIGAFSFRTVLHLEMRNTPFREQEMILHFILSRLPRFSGASLDARGNGQYLAERTAQVFGGWRVCQVALSRPWYLENMPPYKAALEDKSIKLPLDPDVLDDHRALRMENGVAKVPEGARTRGRDGHPRHGDSAIAYALAWHAARTGESAPLEYESTGAARTHQVMQGFV